MLSDILSDFDVLWATSLWKLYMCQDFLNL